MYKKLLLTSLSIMLLLSGCTLNRSEAENETTTEEIIIESSGKDEYSDPNENILPKDIGNSTVTDADVTYENEDHSGFSGISPSEYSGDPYTIINDDVPFFKEDELTTECYTYYNELDSLGRTQYSICVTCKDDLPSGQRGSIGHIKPSGWNQNKYPGLIDTDPPYAMNRAHLVMWAMVGDESNVPENLISGFRYFNESMLINEMIVLDYIKQSGNHVIYRVTPYYTGDNLLADGVLMEAMSVEDKGESLHLCRWVYNVQPGVRIDYATGENEAE